MASRILSLSLCLLVVGPFNLPVQGHVSSKSCTWGSLDLSANFASKTPSQVAETHQVNPGCGYDFAPGVCIYLYAHNDPVNMVDPTGFGAEATAVGQIGVGGIQLTIATAYLKTAAFATATALTDYFSRQQLFLFHVTDATIVQIAQQYNQGAFRTPASAKPMFFATTSTHVASLLLYGVGSPVAIYRMIRQLITTPPTCSTQAGRAAIVNLQHARARPEGTQRP